MSVVSLEYRCDECGEVQWLESPQRPLRRFLRHFCPGLGVHTVMPAVSPEIVLQRADGVVRRMEE